MYDSVEKIGSRMGCGFQMRKLEVGWCVIQLRKLKMAVVKIHLEFEIIWVNCIV